jgi:hypothetical protein
MQMKLAILLIIAIAALATGLRAARLWRDSTTVTPEPEGFEPVVPELRQNWWKIADRKASEKAAEVNRNAAWWTAATAVLGFAEIVAGSWL